MTAFRNEKKIFNQLLKNKNSENSYITKPLGIDFQYKNYFCFAMEYIIGENLGEILKIFGRFEEKTIKFYLAEIIEAIESLHSMGIIHRDIKPENILLDENGHIKLIDFGLSELFEETNSQKTRAKRIVGTPYYIPPEVIAGSDFLEPSLDWWSFGVLMFELLVGVPPFQGISIHEIFQKIKMIEIPWEDITLGFYS